jgi:hypothetical protein
MARFRFSFLLAVAGTVLLGLAPADPLAAAGTAADLQPSYAGYYNSTDGTDGFGGAGFTLGVTKGSTFGGLLEFFLLKKPLGALGEASVTVEGVVKSKGKVTMEGVIGEGSKAIKFKCSGTLGDDGWLLNGAYSLKQGKQTIDKGILTLHAES